MELGEGVWMEAGVLLAELLQKNMLVHASRHLGQLKVDDLALQQKRPMSSGKLSFDVLAEP